MPHLSNTTTALSADLCVYAIECCYEETNADQPDEKGVICHESETQTYPEEGEGGEGTEGTKARQDAKNHAYAR